MKKRIKHLIFALLLFLFSYENCFALSKFCEASGTLRAFKIVGVLIVVIKILVPVGIVLTGIVSLSKAVIEDDESEIKKCASILFSKVIVGVIIFSIPNVVDAVLDLVEKSKITRSDFDHCTKCMVDFKECDGYIEEAVEKEEAEAKANRERNKHGHSSGKF